MSTTRRVPSRLSPKSRAPRSPPWAPWGHDRVTSINASVRCHRKPPPASWSRRLAPVAPGSSGSSGNTTTTAGGWPPHAFPHRPAIASQRPAGRLCHGRAALEPELARRSMAPRSTLPSVATALGLVQRPSVLSKTPPAGAQPCGADTRSATPAGPLGGRPTCDGARPWSVPRPRHTAVFTHTSARFRRILNAANAESKHATRPCTPGVGPRWSRRCRPCVACQARWLYAWGRTWVS